MPPIEKIQRYHNILQQILDGSLDNDKVMIMTSNPIIYSNFIIAIDILGWILDHNDNFAERMLEVEAYLFGKGIEFKHQ